MTFHYFQYNKKIDAEDMNDNFLHIGQGDRLPMGATSLDNTTSVFNLGSATYVWDNLYCDTLYVYSSMSSNGQLWQIESKIVLSATATSIEFTGLNGDNEKEYKIIGRFLGYSNTSFDLFLNSYSSGSYGWQHVKGEGAVLTADRTDSADTIYLGSIDSTTVYNYAICHIFTETGFDRMAFVMSLEKASGTSIGYIIDAAYILNQSTATITSIKIEGNMRTNTQIELWRRK